ncbi:MAG: hypothetical protein Q8P45_02635 [Candidatus Harrisonbacteria bacterium]|nr:hypothetical protein [Candidatus Harrisonbacteria bacterium]
MALRDFLYRHVTAIDIAAAIVILILVMSNVYFALQVDQLRHELKVQTINQQHQKTSTAVVDFMDFFIDRVLRAEGDIDFETRLKLESDVRQLEDEEILIRWQNFTSSQSEPEAQAAVKELLGILINRIKGEG